MLTLALTVLRWAVCDLGKGDAGSRSPARIRQAHPRREVLGKAKTTVAALRRRCGERMRSWCGDEESTHHRRRYAALVYVAPWVVYEPRVKQAEGGAILCERSKFEPQM
jgi:hypothetical protein